jgi:hypothetical protein
MLSLADWVKKSRFLYTSLSQKTSTTPKSQTKKSFFKELPPNYRQSFDVFSKGKMRAFASKAKLFSKRKLASIRVTKKIKNFSQKLLKNSNLMLTIWYRANLFLRRTL